MSFLCSLNANKPRKEKKLPAPKLIGRTAHKSFKRIWDLVMDGQSRIIGVHGMTGVGKTAITKNVCNQLLDTQSNQFDEVIWIECHGDDVMKFYLVYELLKNRKRTFLFLDDIGDHISSKILPLIKPNRENGCKLVFTTRSVDMCTRMGCKEDCIVQVELLPEKEALELFWNTVKVKGNPTPRMIDIADEVVKECARLPLMIEAVGKKFRRKNESQWAKLLSKTKNSGRGIMDIIGNDVNSYLASTTPMDDILMLCALYPKDWTIPTKELIKYMVALDWKANEQRLIMFKSNKYLKSVAVDFEGNHEWGEGVQMQPLYCDFYHHVGGMISKCSLMMKELPEEVKWGVHTTKVSFMCNTIRTISISPKCPKLSVLFLNKNPDLCTISHHFFVHMTGLRILDLRDNLKMETLPDSISDLIGLRVLRLSRCRSLKQVPSLANLLYMQMLELDETAIEELPHGIERLVKLTVLKLQSLSLREAIPSDYLSFLYSLPHLELHL